MAGNQILIYVLAFFLITTKHIRFSDHAMSYPYHHTVHPFLWPPSLLSCLKYLRFSATQSHILSHHHKAHPVLGQPILKTFLIATKYNQFSGHPLSFLINNMHIRFSAIQSHILSSPHSASRSRTTHSHFLITNKYIRLSDHLISYSSSSPQSTSGSQATQSHILPHHHTLYPVLEPPTLITFLITSK